MRRVEDDHGDAPPTGSGAPDARFLDRYSRAIGTYGLDTVVRVASMRVFLVGCGGVGAEAAKNLSLGGIHTLTLFDNTVADATHQSTNFAITDAARKAQPGATRAQLTAPLMTELNPSVRVSVASTLDEQTVGAHHVLLWTVPAPLDELVRWNRFCRTQRSAADGAPMAFISGVSMGVVGSVFVDFGDRFTVRDSDGRPVTQKMITEVTELRDKKGREYTRLRFATPEGMVSGCFPDKGQVRLTDVRGFADGPEPIAQRTLSSLISPFDAPSTMRLYPSLRSLGYGPYGGGGFVVEVKQPVDMTFAELASAVVAPSFEMVDQLRDGEVHLIVHAVLRGGGAPPEDPDALVEAVKRVSEDGRVLDAALPPLPPRVDAPEDPLNEEPLPVPSPPPPRPLHVDTVDEAFVKRVAPSLRFEFQPVCTFIGAVVAQEVVKTAGRYTPIAPWLHFHCAEVLPPTPPPPTPLQGTRYDALIGMFGAEFVARLRGLHVFLVGCGALGCEDLKNLALCGIATTSGSIVITDNDRIEVSNLSRQFLFREDNVGQPKSVAAAARVKTMNADVNIRSLQEFVGASTEHIFSDNFWAGLDVVVNALDNIPSRLYVDDKCVTHRKILVEGGTMGTGGNVDIIVPGQTTSYSDGGGADETGGIPMCTLRNFPYIFDHCIEWARALFEDTFVAPVAQLQQLLEAPDAFNARLQSDVESSVTEGDKRSKLERHIKGLRQLSQTLQAFTSDPSMDTCVETAWRLLFELYRDRVADLTHCFPADAKKKDGEPFWSGHRRFPRELDAANVTLRDELADLDEFIVAASNIFASMFGVHGVKHDPTLNDPSRRWKSEFRTTAWVRGATASLVAPTYVRRAVDGLDDDASSAAATDNAAPIGALEQTLESLLREVHGLRGRLRAQPVRIEFEKDDDDNFHIDFITAAANLRAHNYGIATQDRLKVKLTAGRIIPAIATTTAAVTGLALIEMFKALQGKTNDDLKNIMFDIGSNNYTLFGRDAPISHRSVVQKRYLAESDYTYRTRVVCVPDPFTKYDHIDIPVTQATTVHQVAEALLANLAPLLPPNASSALEVDAIMFGKGSLWDGLPQHPNANAPVLHLIEQQLGGGALFWEGRRVITGLQASLSLSMHDDDCDELDVQTPAIHLLL